MNPLTMPLVPMLHTHTNFIHYFPVLQRPPLQTRPGLSSSALSTLVNIQSCIFESTT